MRRAQPWLTNRARVLRANDTSAEDRVWQAIRSRQLGGYKFVRQLPIGPYFADFACRERKVILEIDGATHSSDGEIAYDVVRSAFLTQKGFRIFRAHNSEIYENLDGVLDTLLAFVEATDASGDTELAAAPHPNPLPVAKGNGERE
jgi:very-short-patch-repair endonuclease